MAGFFYAYADAAAAVAAGAMTIEGDGPAEPAVPGAMVIRTDGIAVAPPEIDPETREIITPATLSAPLVILSPTMMPGCSSALVVPCDHVGFA